ncbi:MAG: carbohydrate kinase family protein, partial [Methanobrevibacter sp.]|nr:carbohydrate kinase family protein [Methanobrevibacter sp.]
GGSAANTIVGLSKLGVSTSIIGKIAEDDDGDLIEYNLAMNGVFSNNLIYADSGSTGKCLGFVDSEGNRCLYVDPGVNDEIVIDEINTLNIMRCKIMHYTSFVGDSFKTQIDLLDNLNKNVVLSFDPGMLYVQKGMDEIKPILDRCDILLINESELRLLFNDEESPYQQLAKSLLDDGIGTVVVKRGSDGVYACNNNEECDVGVFECDVVDTTGAGDSFNSGFLYSYLKDYTLEKSCEIGNWVASKAIEGFGMDKFPTLNELNEFIG